MSDKSNDHIHIEPYNDIWPAKFEMEKKLIEKIIGEWIDGGFIMSAALPCLVFLQNLLWTL